MKSERISKVKTGKKTFTFVSGLEDIHFIGNINEIWIKFSKFPAETLNFIFIMINIIYFFLFL